MSNPNIPDPQSTLVLNRSLRALNAILKKFSNIKFLTGVAVMKQVRPHSVQLDRLLVLTHIQLSGELHVVLANYYVKCATVLSSSLDLSTLSAQSITEIVFVSHLLLKCVARIAVWVWPKLHSNRNPLNEFSDWVRGLPSSSQLIIISYISTTLQFSQLFQTLSSHARVHFEKRTSIMQALRSSSTSLDSASSRNLSLFTRHILTLGKTFRRLEQLDAAKFITLPSCDELVAWYWDQVVQANATPDLIAGVLLGPI